jgi:hypothetical protein
MTLPCRGGSVTELSVTESCQGRGGDWTSVRQRKSDLLVNIAHSPKFHVSRCSKIKLTKAEPPAGNRSVQRNRDDRDDEQCGDQRKRAIE